MKNLLLLFVMLFAFTLMGQDVYSNNSEDETVLKGVCNPGMVNDGRLETIICSNPSIYELSFLASNYLMNAYNKGTDVYRAANLNLIDAMDVLGYGILTYVGIASKIDKVIAKTNRLESKQTDVFVELIRENKEEILLARQQQEELAIELDSSIQMSETGTSFSPQLALAVVDKRAKLKSVRNRLNESNIGIIGIGE